MGFALTHGLSIKKIQRLGIKVGFDLIHGLSIGRECWLHDFHDQRFSGGNRTFLDSLSLSLSLFFLFIFIFYYWIDKGS